MRWQFANSVNRTRERWRGKEAGEGMEREGQGILLHVVCIFVGIQESPQTNNNDSVIKLCI